ncbi:MAG: HI1506-related protein [bacterium]
MIRIISKRNGFYRCGIRHSTTPTDYPDGRFTHEQIRRLKEEPQLVVIEMPGPEPKSGQDETTQAMAEGADINSEAADPERKAAPGQKKGKDKGKESKDES